MKKTCQYCERKATHIITWFRGAFGKPGPIVVPYCGVCSIKDALSKRGMTAPVKEGEDYTLEKKEERTYFLQRLSDWFNVW